jgi:hypothetical protein
MIWALLIAGVLSTVVGIHRFYLGHPVHAGFDFALASIAVIQAMRRIVRRRKEAELDEAIWDVYTYRPEIELPGKPILGEEFREVYRKYMERT